MNKVKFEMSVIKSVNRALQDAGNYHKDGAINWSYVDADVYFDVYPKPSLNIDVDLYYDAFNRYADFLEEISPLLQLSHSMLRR